MGGDPSLDSSYEFPQDEADTPWTFLYDPAGNLSSFASPAELGDAFWFYDAFGQLITEMVPGEYDSDDFIAFDGIPVGFGGQWGYYTDTNDPLQTAGGPTGMGLILLGQRYYDSATGRFLTRDPIGYEGGINIYAYTGNNPVNGIDPSGLWEIWDAGFILADFGFLGYDLKNHASGWEITADMLFLGLDAIPGIPSGGNTLMHAAMAGGRIAHVSQAAHVTTAFVRAGHATDATWRLVQFSNQYGSLGKPTVQALDKAIAGQWKQKGWKLEADAGETQLHLPGPNGGMLGSGRPDIWLTKASPKGKEFNVYINTFTTLKDGITPTAKEARSAQKLIQLLTARHGGKKGWRFLMIPKP